MTLENSPLMSPRLFHHLETDPVCPQDAKRPGTHSIPHQDIKTSVSVQGVVRLAQVEEYDMEDRLPRGNELSKQLFLEGGGPRSSPRMKAM